MFGSARDWKSAAADRLHHMGLSRSARALYTLDNVERPVDERLPHEWRRETERRTRPDTRSRSFPSWLKTFLWL
jgi:hypothetical protein